jgi:ubiquinone/menaquinone biosynthesis C-methylase UbiE
MEFLDPKKAIAHLNLKKGAIVADFGAGVGYLAHALAEEVGKKGTVYVVDIQQDLLTKVMHLANEEHIDVFEYIHADLETPLSTHILDESVDAVVLSNVLFQAEKKENIINEALRILKKGGTILVVDWRDSFGNMGPPPEHIYTEESARKVLAASHFLCEESVDVGSYHYGILCKK